MRGCMRAAAPTHPPSHPSAGPKTNECILSAPLPQLADRCSADPLVRRIHLEARRNVQH